MTPWEAFSAVGLGAFGDYGFFGLGVLGSGCSPTFKKDSPHSRVMGGIGARVSCFFARPVTPYTRNS